MATTHVTYHALRTQGNAILMRRDLRLKNEQDEIRGELRTLPINSTVMFPGYKAKQEVYLKDLERRAKLHTAIKAKPPSVDSISKQKSAAHTTVAVETFKSPLTTTQPTGKKSSWTRGRGRGRGKAFQGKSKARQQSNSTTKAPTTNQSS